MSAARLALGVILLAGAGCRYAPSIESGTLKCSADNRCPEDYGCIEGYCYANEETAATSKFVGRWNFGAQTPQTITCADGGNMNNNLGGDYIEIGPGTTAALTSFYYCDWNLNLNAAGNATVIVPGTSCSAAEPAVPGLSYTWMGEAFTVTTSDGKTATLNASLPYDKVIAGAATVHCTMTITSTMTKGTPAP
jgi:hypothetical protein